MPKSKGIFQKREIKTIVHWMVTDDDHFIISYSNAFFFKEVQVPVSNNGWVCFPKGSFVQSGDNLPEWHCFHHKYDNICCYLLMTYLNNHKGIKSLWRRKILIFLYNSLLKITPRHALLNIWNVLPVYYIIGSKHYIALNLCNS